WNPSGYHAVNLALHLLNTVLVWRLFRRLRLALPLLGAGIFALHPVAVQSVAWLTQQPMLLAWSFALGFLLLQLHVIDPPIDDPELRSRWSNPVLLQLLAAALF